MELYCKIDIEFWSYMYRIGGRQRDVHASVRGAVVGIPLLCDRGSNLVSRTGTGRVSGGQFDWGGRLPKSNGGALKVRSDWMETNRRVQLQKRA